MNVLIVENGVSKGIDEMLRANGHRPSRRRLGADALAACATADVVLLDLVLPDLDGLDVLRRLRRASEVPAMVLAAHNDERSVVAALRAGADDYLVKPLRPAETLARIQAVARRATSSWDVPRQVVQVENVAVDLSARAVWVGTSLAALTTKEFDVLAVLARNVGKAVSRERILQEVWGHRSKSRALDVHLTSLRIKLGEPKTLGTIHGFGYRFG